MECKNCLKPLPEIAGHCSACGAKVVRGRLTVRTLVVDAAHRIFGWDRGFWHTLRTLLAAPEKVLSAYVSGIRKRFINPFAFFAISVAVAVIVFNLFSSYYVELNNQFNDGQANMWEDLLPDKTGESGGDSNDTAQGIEMRETNEKVQKIMLKYFNLSSFVLLPFYALIAFLVFRKPYNYAEHLVINAYIQGITLLFSVVAFLIALMVHPSFYYLTAFSTIIYYCYAYARLYRLSFWKTLMMLFKFIGIVLLFFMLLVALGMLIGFLIALFLKDR